MCHFVYPALAEVSYGTKVGQIVRRTWLVRLYTDRDLETKERRYLNQTIHGPLLRFRFYRSRRADSEARAPTPNLRQCGKLDF